MAKQRTFKLSLGGYPITVRRVKGLAERRDAEGEWDEDARRIDIDDALSRAGAQEVLIHECAHAVSDLFGLDLSERQVRQLAIGLHQMLLPFLKGIP